MQLLETVLSIGDKCAPQRTVEGWASRIWISSAGPLGSDGCGLPGKGPPDHGLDPTHHAALPITSCSMHLPLSSLATEQRHLSGIGHLMVSTVQKQPIMHSSLVPLPSRHLQRYDQ